MACNDCSLDWFWQKLGRCRTCMWQCFCLCLLSSLAWAWLGFSHNVQGLTALLFLASSGGLLLLHFLAWLWRACRPRP